MPFDESPRVGYVVKRYPRFSETFVVNEILAHEAAGLAVEIFSLRPPVDTHFQDAVARVKAPVRYLGGDGVRASDLWSALQAAASECPSLWAALEEARGEDAVEVCQALALARDVRRRGICHLHAHFATSAATVARLAARFAGVPYTLTAHAKDIFHESVRRDDLERKLRDAAAVVTVSEFNREYLRATFGPAADRVRRVYNGLDLERFAYAPPTDRPPVVVSVGRLVEKKGFEDLIDACVLLRGAGRSFRCRIVGTGELEGALRDRIARLALGDVVDLLGPRPQAEVIGIVRGAAAFAAPCVVGSDGNRDGLPTVLLEAMALGTPCVATDVTGIPEILVDEETGLLVPQRAPAALAAALGRLLDDPALRLRLAGHARQLVEQEFDVDANAAEVRALFMGRRAASASAEVVR